MNNFSINDAIRCLKQINDSNRCLICDKLEGRRLRFTCGHITCDKCSEDLSECKLCICTDLQPHPKPDESSTCRAENASLLSKCFETTFGVNLNARMRLSEQLKLEREVFPKCIQAPTKYSNKTKETNSSFKSRKSSHSFFLGENISPIIKMQRSSYVQQWLEQNEEITFDSLPRIPLGNLDVNSPRTLSKTPLSLRKNENRNDRTKKRKSTSKFLIENKRKRLDKNFILPQKHKKNEIEFKSSQINSLSGPIVIEDSESEHVVDKDREALLAVERAEEQARNKVSDESHYHKNTVDQSVQNYKKVPFYKKAFLKESCRYCASNKPEDTSDNESNNICITIENNSFSTMIKVSKSSETFKISNLSVYTQTDVSRFDEENHNGNTSNEKSTFESISELKITSHMNNILSTTEQFLNEDNKSDSEKPHVPTDVLKSVVIADSDSDDNTEHSFTVQVRAEVHNSNEEFFDGILTELDPHDLQPRRGIKRAITPSSSNSSEKENFDPNKFKKFKDVKKKK